jgi:SAM-dependent methyltransferase
MSSFVIPGSVFGETRCCSRTLPLYDRHQPAEYVIVLAGRVTTMGFYSQRVVPRVLDKACGMKAVYPLRERVCAGLTGEVIEVGFGSGSNVAFYPATVRQVTAVEPSDVAWRLATKRIAASGVSVQRAGLDGQCLPFDGASFDAALSTWTMCTIPDAVTALQELRRVLKPGAPLHFLEHGLAPDPKVQRWQHRFDPLQGRLFAGCSLSRPIVDLLNQAGFTIKEIDVFYEEGTPKFLGADSLGVAA